MKLGLGLSIPGIAASGGKAAARLYAESEFWIDARTNPSNGVPIDQSGNARAITVGGTPTFTAGVEWTFNGSSDYFEMADADDLDFSGTDSFTAIVVFTQTGTSAATYMAKRATTGNTPGLDVGWFIQNVGDTNTAMYRGDNGNTIEQETQTWSPGVKTALTLVRTPTAATLFANGTGTGSAITAGSLANSLVLRIGRLSGAGAQYAGINFHAAGLWRRALTSTEQAAIRADLGL